MFPSVVPQALLQLDAVTSTVLERERTRRSPHIALATRCWTSTRALLANAATTTAHAFVQAVCTSTEAVERGDVHRLLSTTTDANADDGCASDCACTSVCVAVGMRGWGYHGNEA